MIWGLVFQLVHFTEYKCLITVESRKIMPVLKESTTLMIYMCDSICCLRLQGEISTIVRRVRNAIEKVNMKEFLDKRY